MNEDILNLKHVEKSIPGGGSVLVLNNGAIITSEDEAMLQALHSRSPKGIKSHLSVLAKSGSGKLMETFYVGYGHKSIGDCGSGTIFIEGVSMLAAKAIQDWMLYSGQECSTRYIDFSTQPFVDPLGTKESKQVLENLRSFYVKNFEPLKLNLKERYPMSEGEDEKIYDKAISARAFDILRGFLPAGASTNLAWHSNLRQIADKLMTLRHHPLKEVRDISVAIDEAVSEFYPHSFGHKKYEGTESYNESWMKEGYYFEPKQRWPEMSLVYKALDADSLEAYRWFFENRPDKTVLPKQIGECGTMQFAFLLDFGSFRDIQRQRSVIQRMPRLTMNFGFEEWYLSELPFSIRKEAEKLIDSQRILVNSLLVDSNVTQYYVPMGYRVANRITGDIPSLVYIAELRAAATVHPTLHKRAIQIADIIMSELGEYGLKLGIERGAGRFDVKRGKQDIVQKNN